MVKVESHSDMKCTKVHLSPGNYLKYKSKYIKDMYICVCIHCVLGVISLANYGFQFSEFSGSESMFVCFIFLRGGLFKIALLCALIQHTICKVTSNQSFEINVVEYKVADI